jgi:hypothetical protein
VKAFIRIALLLLIPCSSVLAEELSPFIKGAELGIVVKGTLYPSTLSKDLSSGLTNRILIRVALLDQTQSLDQRAVEIAIKYDLWDETFAMSIAVDSAVIDSHRYSNIQEVRAVLAHTRLPALFKVNDLRSNKELIVKAEVLLNPLDRERMEKIRKWVAQNSTYTPLDPTSVGSARPAGSSTSNQIFNKIFEQYTVDTDVAAVWKETITSRPFRLIDVPREHHE